MPTEMQKQNEKIGKLYGEAKTTLWEVSRRIHENAYDSPMSQRADEKTKVYLEGYVKALEDALADY